MNTIKLFKNIVLYLQRWNACKQITTQGGKYHNSCLCKAKERKESKRER